jgi:diguanylate cyclase (GGDEF)-like protein/PAS domain S-box-containing protein
LETDITEMRVTRMYLERLSREQTIMLDTELVGIVKLRERVSVWSNRGLARMFGYTEAELRGASVRLLYPDDESYAALGAAAYPVLRNGGTYRTQLQMRHSSGRLIWVDISGVQVSTDPDESMWLMSDITALKHHELAMVEIAFHDSLTGLPNRALLQDRLSQALATAGRPGQALAVAYLDLDGFKAVNDTHGHDAGDDVLCAVGQRLKATLRDSDTVARLGGDEFVFVLSPAGTAEEVAEVVRRVQSAIAQPIALRAGGHARVGASIGLAHYPDDGDTVAALLTLADERMFQTKRVRQRSTSP